mmetsp:Transcript_16453/g.38421  ORF Transcript_16453/g.38421 Transcript_16453/m.38421 type:complete len:131 (-) Transcript_16453:273-665(-)|eukprot:CAMPEP_0182573658 /NCGR_PEP_ID=MMETSP1324-20130603/20345_1 /TAXON_ID=236786 /ORGANISM="Florenciella sp., Strain RCC1587" /LENGTH=130 /DNA_ID=CAMNT_0024788799 /DNA_START=212 /DNA_END=604 /DNA_ORIENTATION=+
MRGFLGLFCRDSAETPEVPKPMLESEKGASEGGAGTVTGTDGAGIATAHSAEAVDSASASASSVGGDETVGSPAKTTAASFKDIQADSLDTPVKNAMNGQVNKVERNEKKSTRRLSIKVKAPPPPPSTTA